MSKFRVTKCICHDRKFSEIKRHAEKNDYSTVGELQSEQFCSCGCGLCIPYIDLMFETGETEFEPGAFYKNKTA